MPDEMIGGVAPGLLAALVPPALMGDESMQSPSPPPPPPGRDLTNQCIHLGVVMDRHDPDGNLRGCVGCWKYVCDLHQQCSISHERTDCTHCCRTCEQYEP